MSQNFAEKRSDYRSHLNQFYSVEFSIGNIEFAYQFKIWNVSPRGMCVMVRPDSDLLKHIRVGDILNMKYYKNDSARPTEFLKTKIKHITRDNSGRFRDHYLIGLSILGDQAFA